MRNCAGIFGSVELDSVKGNLLRCGFISVTYNRLKFVPSAGQQTCLIVFFSGPLCSNAAKCSYMATISHCNLQNDISPHNCIEGPLDAFKSKFCVRTMLSSFVMHFY